jgi:hypothetical protein
VDLGSVLEFDSGDALNRAQRADGIGVNRAGKYTYAGQSRICPKAERSAGASHLIQSVERLVSDGNGHPDLSHPSQGA